MLCMYVYIYIYIYTYVYTQCIYIYIYIYVSSIPEILTEILDVLKDQAIISGH